MRIRRLAALAAVLLLAAWLPHDRSAPNRWALIIGISDYEHFGDEIGGDLPGASWDARRMRDVLVARWGFEPDRVRMILDRDATRERIIHELSDWLPAVVKENDHVFFYFAGHGSQTWNEDGTADDGLDQTICPTDVLKGDPSRDIRDKELGGFLRALATPNVVALLDNCHAGTGTRQATPFVRPRTLARDVNSLERPAALTRAGTTTVSYLERDILEIAAAQSWEIAADVEWPGADGGPSTFGGAFTTTLVRQLWRAPRSTTYEDLFHMTVEDMKRQRFAQQPLLTLTGAERRPFASMDGAAATPDEVALPVRSVSGRVIELAGGAGAGVTVGSLYQVGNAVMRITGVDGGTARAELVSGSAPPRGAPARIVAYAFPRAVLRVSVADVDAATGAALRQAVGTGGGTVAFIASPREFAHLLVRPGERGYVIIGMDGAVRHELLLADRTAALRGVAERLKAEAATHQLAALDNPGQAMPLDFGFEGGRTVFRVGDEVSFVVRVPREGYLSIVDLGTDGSINVLFPNEDTPDSRVQRGQVVRLPSGSDVQFAAQEPAGRGIVRAFLTDRPLRLSLSDDEPETAATIMAALRQAAGSPAVAGSDAVPTGNWLTGAVVYTIERR
jgi:hypothetical protein